MFCEKCGKNNATTHIKTIVNGVVTSEEVLSEVVHGIKALISTGYLKPQIGKKFTLDEATEAHEHLMGSSGDGRTIFEIIKE